MGLCCAKKKAPEEEEEKPKLSTPDEPETKPENKAKVPEQKTQKTQVTQRTEEGTKKTQKTQQTGTQTSTTKSRPTKEETATEKTDKTQLITERSRGLGAPGRDTRKDETTEDSRKGLDLSQCSSAKKSLNLMSNRTGRDVSYNRGIHTSESKVEQKSSSKK